MKKTQKIFILLTLVLSILPLSVSAKTNNKGNKNFVEVIADTLTSIFTSEEKDVITVNEDFSKIDESLNEYTFDFSGNNDRYVIIKQAKKMVIWTEKIVKEEDQKEFLTDLKAINKDKSLKDSYFEDVTFIYGIGEFDLSYLGKQFGVYNFDMIEKRVKLYCDASKISHANYGTYINENDEEITPEVEYVWKEVSRSDGGSATAFAREESNNYYAFKKAQDTNGAQGNWFQAQTLNFDGLDKITMDIQVGNFKEGHNFAGEYTLTKNENQYTISYTENSLPNEEDYKVGDTYTLVVLTSPKYIASVDRIALQSNGGGTSYTNGDSFVMDSNVFNFYAHFNVELVEYVLDIK